MGLGRREEWGNGALSFPASDAFCVHFFLRMGVEGVSAPFPVSVYFYKRSFQEVSGVLVSVPLSGALLGLLLALPLMFLESTI